MILPFLHNVGMGYSIEALAKRLLMGTHSFCIYKEISKLQNTYIDKASAMCLVFETWVKKRSDVIASLIR